MRSARARVRCRAGDQRGDERGALAAYRRADDGAFRAASLHVLALARDGIEAMTDFLDPRVLGAFEVALALADA